MTTAAPTVALTCRGARQVVSLAEFVDADVRESAAVEANRWIKGLRLARVDGEPLRDRFRHRGDSLWWFTELYLHKEARVVGWLETLRALEQCVDAHAPERMALADGTDEHAALLQRVAARRGIAPDVPEHAQDTHREAFASHRRTRFFTWSAHLSRWRPRPSVPAVRTGGLVAFVHSAFWRHGRGDEGYIGDVLDAVRAEGPDRNLTLVGVGPRVNFRARTWWHGLTTGPADARLPFAPVEAFAGRAAIAPAWGVWARRHDDERALLGSEDVRASATIAGYDLWPLVRHELQGVVRLQWPWSARAMDEAGAALDGLAPSAVVTYAEAGGWGRAIVLEARRRGIPSVGVQHGFIYRHWLNYRHEIDEMAPSPGNPDDRGFPAPTRTLLFDHYAAEHLRTAGHFPEDSLEVCGNPRLDALVAAHARITPTDQEAIRASVHAAPGEHVVVVAAKYTQMRRVFRAVAEAAAARPGLRLVVKCHPAETPEPYLRDAEGLAGIEVVGAGADLAALLAVARGLVTVNSTVALDALVLGVPSLVVDLPNNLSPFVDRGVMLGAEHPDRIAARLDDLVDGPSRAAILARRDAFLAQYRIGADGQAARRAARAILGLAGSEMPRKPAARRA